MPLSEQLCIGRSRHRPDDGGVHSGVPSLDWSAPLFFLCCTPASPAVVVAAAYHENTCSVTCVSLDAEPFHTTKLLCRTDLFLSNKNTFCVLLLLGLLRLMKAHCFAQLAPAAENEIRGRRHRRQSTNGGPPSLQWTSFFLLYLCPTDRLFNAVATALTLSIGRP